MWPSLLLVALFLCLTQSSATAQTTPGKQATPSAPDSALYQYQADRVEEDYRHRRTVFTGNVVLKFQDIELRAGRIVFDRNTQQLEAEALPDSTGKKTVGLPRFSQGKEQFTGTRMVYNLRTGRGTVRGGRAVHQRKYYRGEQILMNQQQEELYARSISMSTCNKDHVHYDFLCRTLKVVENDKAIARSVTFRIGPVPIFWLPFYVFPLQQGRRSGILTPGVGSNSRDGFYANNLGYYWAPSEYWDTTLRTALRERNGYRLDSDFMYVVRNRLDGSANFSFENGHNSSGGTLRAWRFYFQHQQRLDPTLNIRANGDFSSSSSFSQRNSDNIYDYLNRQIRSSFSLDKRWTESGRSLDANLSYVRDLERDQNRFQGFPRLSFRQGRRRLFGGPGASTPKDAAWFHAFYYDFSTGLTNNFTRNPDPEDNTEDLTVDGRLSISSQHRPFGWLDLNPSLRVTESLSRNNQNRPTRQETYFGSISSGTSLYGIFHPHIGRLRGLRHRLQPRLDFQYNQTAQVQGGTFGFGGQHNWDDPQRSLNMSLNNTLETKTEVDGKEHRSTFATAGFNTGYNFDITSAQKWRPLQTSVSVKPDQRVDIRLSTSHTLYDSLDQRALLHPRLQSFTITSNFRFQGKGAHPPNQTPNFSSLSPTGSDFGIEADPYADIQDATQPWRFNLSHYFDFRKPIFTGGANQKRSWLKGDLAINPAPGWRFNYSLNYDLIDARVTAQSLNIYRSLHCWEARFSWYPTGFNRGFYFKINIKDIPQIKYEHRQGGYGL